jgi:hypothetical protein
MTTVGFAQSATERAIWQQVEALNNAIFQTKDSIVIKGLVGENISYAHSGGNIEDKMQMVAKAVSSPTTYKNIRTERISVRLIKKVAIVRHNFHAIQNQAGVESPLDLGVLQVWAKEGGKWRLQARQSVKLPAAK